MRQLFPITPFISLCMGMLLWPTSVAAEPAPEAGPPYVNCMAANFPLKNAIVPRNLPGLPFLPSTLGPTPPSMMLIDSTDAEVPTTIRKDVIDAVGTWYVIAPVSTPGPGNYRVRYEEKCIRVEGGWWLAEPAILELPVTLGDEKPLPTTAGTLNVVHTTTAHARTIATKRAADGTCLHWNVPAATFNVTWAPPNDMDPFLSATEVLGRNSPSSHWTIMMYPYSNPVGRGFLVACDEPSADYPGGAANFWVEAHLAGSSLSLASAPIEVRPQCLDGVQAPYIISYCDGRPYSDAAIDVYRPEATAPDWDGGRVTPESGTAMPESGTAMPESGSAMPESGTAMPDVVPRAGDGSVLNPTPPPSGAPADAGPPIGNGGSLGIDAHGDEVSSDDPDLFRSPRCTLATSGGHVGGGVNIQSVGWILGALAILRRTSRARRAKRAAPPSP